MKIENQAHYLFLVDFQPWKISFHMAAYFFPDHLELEQNDHTVSLADCSVSMRDRGKSSGHKKIGAVKVMY